MLIYSPMYSLSISAALFLAHHVRSPLKGHRSQPSSRSPSGVAQQQQQQGTQVIVSADTSSSASSLSTLPSTGGPVPSSSSLLAVPSHLESGPSPALTPADTPARSRTVSLDVHSKRLIIVAKQLPVITRRTANGGWEVEWQDSRSFVSGLKILK